MDLFETHENYFRILGEAQQNTSPVQRPPFVARYLAFWNPIIVSGADAPPTSTLREARWTNVDKYLVGLQRKLDHRNTKSGKSPTFGISNFRSPTERGGKVFLFGNSTELAGDGTLIPLPTADPTSAATLPIEVVNFEFDWFGLGVTLRFELHVEYFSISSFINLSAEKTTCGDLAEIRGLTSALATLASNIGKDFDPATYTTQFNALYGNIWQAFERDILGVSHQAHSGFGKVFADFRSLVLGQSIAEAGPMTEVKFNEPFWWKGQPTPERHIPMEDTWWQTVRRNFWPFLTTTYSELNFVETEFAVTQLLGGRALYASAFGAQRDEVRSNDRMPLFFLLYATSLNGWQIGRLVNKLHHLGTVRLAALMEFTLFRSAGYALRGIEKAVKSAAQIYHLPIDAQIPSGTLDEENAHLARENALKEAITRIEVAMARLNADFDGDIEYRLARSAYYIRQFREGISLLRMKRLQGYQRYDQFIERRLGPAFNFIELLGAQYERVASDKAGLFQYYLEQQERCATVGTRNRNSKLVRLQRSAEFALVGILAPYYIASTITHILGIAEQPGVLTQGIWLAVLVGALLECGRRILDNLHEDRRGQTGAAPIRGGMLSITLKIPKPSTWLWITGEIFIAALVLAMFLWRHGAEN